MAKVGERIRELREKKALSQDELAGAVGLSRNTVYHYETGKRSPDANAIISLADYFNVSTDYLLGRTNHNRPGISEFSSEYLAKHYKDFSPTQQESVDMILFDTFEMIMNISEAPSCILSDYLNLCQHTVRELNSLLLEAISIRGGLIAFYSVAESNDISTGDDFTPEKDELTTARESVGNIIKSLDLLRMTNNFDSDLLYIHSDIVKFTTCHDLDLSVDNNLSISKTEQLHAFKSILAVYDGYISRKNGDVVDIRPDESGVFKIFNKDGTPYNEHD